MKIKFKNKYLLIIILIISVIDSKSQANLVMNPGFEEDSFCTSLHGGIASGAAYNWGIANVCTGWYLNICANVYNDIDRETTVPNNIFGFQFPHNGVAYASFGPYTNWGDGHSYREYPKGILRDTLVAGKKYGIQFYLSKAEPYVEFFYRYCISNMGFYFSDTNIFYNNSDVLPLIPQFRNDSLNELSDTLGWQKVEGSYMASGGERYFIIGNFDDNAHTKIFDCFNNGVDLSSPIGEIFYYIDDVSVIDTSIIDTVQLCINDSVYLQGAWHKSAGLFYDTIAGMPYQKYLKPVSYASTHTIQYYAGHVGDSFKTAYFWSKIFALKDTTFNIIMPSIYGCDSVIVCRLVDSNIIGINPNNQYSLEGNLNLQIYPNPSSQLVNIVISSKSNDAIKNTKDIKLYVYDLMAKQMKIKPVPKINNEKELSYLLNISEFSSGMYFIKLVDKENRIMGSARFIKE